MVIPHLGDGGVQRVVTILSAAWNKSGKTVWVVSLYKDKEFYQLAEGVIHIRLFEWTGAGIPLKLLEKLRYYLQEHPRDSVFFRFLKYELQRLMTWIVRFSLVKVPIALFLSISFRRVLKALILTIYLPLTIRARALRRLLIYSNTPNIVAFCGSTNVIAVVSGKSLKQRLIISERNDPALQQLQFPWDHLRKLFYEDADVVSVNSRGALETLSKFVPREKLVFVPNPLLPPEKVSECEQRSSGLNHRFLIVARLHPQKGHDILLKAFATCHKELPDWRLSVVGQGELDENLKTLAHRLGIDDRVDWHGQVCNVYDFYGNADIFILPSRYEGTPNALLEAMNCALPSIISDSSPGPLELITHMETGLVVPTGDHASLATAMIELARNNELRQKLGPAAKKKVTDYDLPKALNSWEKVLRA